MVIDLKKWNDRQSGLDSPPRTFETVTPHDSNDFAKVCRAIYVGTTGNVAAVDVDGNVWIHKAVPAGSYVLGLFRRVNLTNTTAADMLAVS